ncbi:MAG TPA: lipoyl(octanoyl) transferase LipB [Fimbriimonadaceae bacterium]|jgi:lipoate-protein ligase B
MRKQANLVDLGHLAYSPATQLQKRLLESVATGKELSTLLFVEHDPVLTLGANFHKENLLLTGQEYNQKGIQLEKTERGGDVTYHGPNQLVIYPIFNLNDLGKDLHKWLRDLEETIILTLQHFGLTGVREPDINTGVWVNGKKIAAIGIKVRRWTSMHGIALNCNNDLTPFKTIIPCGIKDYGVTSLTQETGLEITLNQAKPIITKAFEKVFNLDFQQLTPADLRARIG